MVKNTIGIVFNPKSGYNQATRAANMKHIESFTEILSSIRYSVKDLSDVTYDAALEGCQRAVDKGEISHLIVFGGDGMVSLGFNSVRDSKIPLGIVPFGSGNDYAKALKIPTNKLSEVVRGIAYGIIAKTYKSVDAGIVKPLKGNDSFTKKYFAGSLSSGIDSQINLTANNLKIAPGPSRYLIAGIKEMSQIKSYGYKVTYGKKVFDQDGAICCVSNAPCIGGGVKISPDSKLDDGWLRIVLCDELKPAGALALISKSYAGVHIHDPRVIYEKCKKVIIEERKGAPRIPFLMADGEYVGRAPAEISIAPKLIRVIFHPNAL